MYRIIRFALLALLFMPLIAFLFHYSVVYWNINKFPPPGHFIQSPDGHKIHIVCHDGTNNNEDTPHPVIIFETGLGSDATLIWGRIAKKSAPKTKACFYDRAGYGWSDHAKSPRTFDNQARDLNAVINDVAKNREIILVAHSIGGIIIRNFAHNNDNKNNNKIAAMIFVDSSHEDQKSRLPKPVSGPPSRKTWLPPDWKARYGAHFGLMRLDAKSLIPKFPWLSDNEYKRLLETASGAKYHRARLTEQAAFDQYQSQPLATLNYNFHNIPISILSQDTYFPVTDNPFSLKYKATWRDLQQEITKLSPWSTFREVEKTGHLIPLFKPETIIDEINSYMN